MKIISLSKGQILVVYISTSQFDFVLCTFCIMPVIFQMISISENILNIPIPINVQDGINVQGGIFTQNQ